MRALASAFIPQRCFLAALMIAICSKIPQTRDLRLVDARAGQRDSSKWSVSVADLGDWANGSKIKAACYEDPQSPAMLRDMVTPRGPKGKAGGNRWRAFILCQRGIESVGLVGLDLKPTKGASDRTNVADRAPQQNVHTMPYYN